MSTRRPSHLVANGAAAAPYLAAWFFTAALAQAAAAADAPGLEDLFQVVPADVGLAVEARDLHGTLASFAEGPVFQRWKQYPPLAKWHAEQESHIQKLSEQLKRRLGVSWDDLRSRLFSKQWVLGVFPPRGGDRTPDGFLLVRAADAELLARAADKLFDAQRAEGNYLGNSRARFGTKEYTIHELKAVEKNHSLYLTYDGVFGALAVRRETLDRVLKLASGVDQTTPPLAADEMFQAGLGRLAPGAVLRAFARPKAWIPAEWSSDEGIAVLSDPQKSAVQVARATNYVVASLDLKEIPRAELHIGWDSAKLPELVRDVAAGLRNEMASAAETIPGDALAAVATSIDSQRLSKAFGRAAGAEAESRRESLSIDTIIGLRLLGSVGPRGVGYVTPPRQGAQTRSRLVPVDWVVGVDTQSVGAGPVALVDTLDPLLRTAMSLAADVLQTRGFGGAKIETLRADPLTITGLTGLWADSDGGVFVARQNGRLWAGSTPAALVEGATITEKSSLEADSQFRRIRNPRLAGPDHFVYLNLAGLRAMLDQLLEQRPEWVPTDKSELFAGGIRESRKFLSLVDRALVEAEVTAEGASLSVAVAVDAEN